MAYELTEIIIHKQSRSLEVAFATGERFVLPFEYLRVFSPSAEVRGHGNAPMQWVTGKENIDLVAIEPVGNYGIKPFFDDGHQSGIFSWETLHTLGRDYAANWERYQLAVKPSSSF